MTYAVGTDGKLIPTYYTYSFEPKPVLSSNERVVNDSGITITNANGYYFESSGKSKGGGGAIYNDGTIQAITGDFVRNHANDYSASSGGAIYNRGAITGITGDFIGNYASNNTNVSGGAIYNLGTITKILNSSFINNYASNQTSAQGGAIWSSKDLLIEADGGVSEFTGNYVEIDGRKTYNAIYMAEANTTLNLNSINNGTITVNDGIDGVSGYKLKLSGDNSGRINFNNQIMNADIVTDSAITVNVAKASYLNSDSPLSLSLNGGTINILNYGQTQLLFNDLELKKGTINLSNVEYDLSKTPESNGDPYFSYNNSFSGDVDSAKIIVQSINITQDMKPGTDMVISGFIKDDALKSYVSSNVTSARGPVFDYGIDFDPSTGNAFTFARKDYNPEVLSSSIATVAAVSVLSDEIYSRALADADKAPAVVADSREFSNAWVKTFGADDTVDLNGFSNADARFNGIIGGIGSGRVSEGSGVSATYNIYSAYANGESEFADEKILQDAYYLGVGANFYKGNAFLGTTANVAMIRNHADMADGKDKFSSYIGGMAAKTGYNFDVAGLIVQPNLYASYTYISANDYTTSRDARVKMNGMSNIELAPGLKVAKELEDGLGVYAKTRYVHTFNESQKAYANDFLLPEISLKPYVEYGLGVEKSTGSYSGFAEIMRRDGGREGWNSLIGLKYNF